MGRKQNQDSDMEGDSEIALQTLGLQGKLRFFTLYKKGLWGGAALSTRTGRGRRSQEGGPSQGPASAQNSHRSDPLCPHSREHGDGVEKAELLNHIGSWETESVL